MKRQGLGYQIIAWKSLKIGASSSSCCSVQEAVGSVMISKDALAIKLEEDMTACKDKPVHIGC
jgi:hypothetical protein